VSGAATAALGVVGHEPVLAALLAAHAEGTLSHATLLTGPDGVGKTTVALALAETILDGSSWPRSEERRVGKECEQSCRSRWSPYH
jgi:DNA polymerase III gamma/tau subunit